MNMQIRIALLRLRYALESGDAAVAEKLTQGAFTVPLGEGQFLVLAIGRPAPPPIPPEDIPEVLKPSPPPPSDTNLPSPPPPSDTNL